MDIHDASLPYASTPLRDWHPNLPAGELHSIVLHWSGGTYEALYPAYHFCVASGAEPRVYATHDLRNNMRDVRMAGPAPYAAHTHGRNSFAIGIAMMCMRDATPSDFGAFALTEQLVAGLARVAAVLARRYGIAIDAAHVYTHAEAAIEDGYFGAGDDGVRWDIARLAPSPQPLVAAEAVSVGDILRQQIRGL